MTTSEMDFMFISVVIVISIVVAVALFTPTFLSPLVPTALFRECSFTTDFAITNI